MFLAPYPLMKHSDLLSDSSTKLNKHVHTCSKSQLGQIPSDTLKKWFRISKNPVSFDAYHVTTMLCFLKLAQEKTAKTQLKKWLVSGSGQME